MKQLLIERNDLEEKVAQRDMEIQHGKQQSKAIKDKSGGLLGKLKRFLIGPNDSLQKDTKHRNIKSGKSTAIVLYNREGREDGAVSEAVVLESGFRTQGSHVIRHEWITAGDLHDKLHTFIHDVPSECQLMFVCVMSHGAPGVMCGADGVIVPLNDLLYQLNHSLPPELLLVVLVQACQNIENTYFGSQVVDAMRASYSECTHIDLKRPHTVLLRSTVTGGYSLRGAYTEAIAHQIGSADGNKSIHDMHEDAVEAMRSKLGVAMDETCQVPEYRDTLQGRKVVLEKACY